MKQHNLGVTLKVPRRDHMFAPNPPLQQQFVSTVSFVDDLVAVVESDDPRDLPVKIVSATQILHASFLKRGLQLNLGPGKTEALVVLNGTQSKLERRKMLIDNQSVIKVPGVGDLRLVDTYAHLGGTVCTNCSIAPEIASRVAKHSKAINALHHVFKKSRELSVQQRAIFAEACAGTTLLHNAATWNSLHPADIDKLNRAILDRTRRIVKLPRGDGHHSTSEQRICSLFKPIRAQEAIAAARLRYLARLMAWGPDCVWATIYANSTLKGSFFQLIKDDVGWLAACCDSPPVDFGRSSLQSVADFARAQPALWHTAVSRALEASRWKKHDLLLHSIWRTSLNDMLLASARLSLGDSIRDETPVEYCICYDCDASFQSRRAWNLHMRFTHGVRRCHTSFTYGTVCPACALEFHEPRRLTAHFKRPGNSCFPEVCVFWEPMTEREAQSLANAEKVQTAAKRSQGMTNLRAVKPAYRIIGPTIQGRAQILGISAQDCAIYVDAAPPIVHMPRQQDSNHLPNRVVPISRIQGSFMYLLHLFSGQRREHDLQHAIEGMPRLARLIVISVDIVHGGPRSDVSIPANAAYWADFAMNDAVAAVVSGPPCETWTVARYMPGGPAPLRERAHPWGMPHLTKDRAKQVEVANLLLRFAIRINTIVAARGGAVIMEHPACPSWKPHAPSIWRLPELAHLQRCYDMQILSFDQCTCGGISRKPTSLLVANIPSASTLVRALPGRGFCNHSRGHPALIGKTASGTFATTPAKQYPRDMCQLLANMICSFVDRAISFASNVPEWSEVSPDVRACYVPLDPYVCNSFGPDYAR